MGRAICRDVIGCEFDAFFFFFMRDTVMSIVYMRKLGEFTEEIRGEGRFNDE